MAIFDIDAQKTINVITILYQGMLEPSIHQLINRTEDKDVVIQLRRINLQISKAELLNNLPEWLVDTDLLIIIGTKKKLYRYLIGLYQYTQQHGIVLTGILNNDDLRQIKKGCYFYLSYTKSVDYQQQQIYQILSFLISIFIDKRLISLDIEDLAVAFSYNGMAFLTSSSSRDRNNEIRAQQAIQQALDKLFRQIDVVKIKFIAVNIAAPTNFNLAELTLIGDVLEKNMSSVERIFSTKIDDSMRNKIEIKLLTIGREV